MRGSLNRVPPRFPAERNTPAQPQHCDIAVLLGDRLWLSIPTARRSTQGDCTGLLPPLLATEQPRSDNFFCQSANGFIRATSCGQRSERRRETAGHAARVHDDNALRETSNGGFFEEFLAWRPGIKCYMNHDGEQTARMSTRNFGATYQKVLGRRILGRCFNFYPHNVSTRVLIDMVTGETQEIPVPRVPRPLSFC
jgi:hypothetical protein